MTSYIGVCEWTDAEESLLTDSRVNLGLPKDPFSFSTCCGTWEFDLHTYIGTGKSPAILFI